LGTLALIIGIIVIVTSKNGRRNAALAPSTTSAAAGSTGAVGAEAHATATPAPGAVSYPAPGAVSRDLGAVVFPAPAGYAVSTSPDVTTGPIPAAELDKLMGGPGLAARLGFVRAYEMVYDSSRSSDSIDIALGTLKSAAAAIAFVPLAVKVQLDTFRDEAPVQHAFASIPGAVEVDGTKLSSNGTLDHEVIAAKGTTLVALDYKTDHVGTVPAAFGTWVSTQCARV
jgi:hypothetical protein